ncbi:MAG: heavy metal sensor histidine kinase [Bordetella sp.]|nr:heavy metal sensor histidine kinase [Pseudomonadota bacterium]MDQ8016046.1 heavy metal sensor histidine kinase [Pseudomonadota bacterium]
MTPRNSIAIRLALMYAVVALVVFSLVGVALHQVLSRELARHRHEQVQGRLEDVRYLLVHGRSPQLASRAKDKIAALVSHGGETRFWMWSDDPAFRWGEGAEAIAAHMRTHSGVVDLPVGPGGSAMAVLSVDVPANDIRAGLQLIAAVSEASFSRTLRAFETALALLTVVGVVSVGLLGFWIARLGLRPVQQLSEDARRIGPDNRGQRLELPDLPLELSQLGGSFNAALDRLDAAYRQLETFNADVAHELRTPLANLIGQTQVTLARERDAPELREVLQSNLEELERLRAIVADMLFLARAEQGERAHRLTESSLAQEVDKTVEFFDVLLEDAGMHVEVVGDAVAPIETSLFRRALSNLLQNAIQHSTGGGTIVARIERHGDRAEVSFSNPSEPIPAEQLARLFDRFYRVDAARHNSGENHGLGLAIVKAVAAMHGGTVFARSGEGVTTIGFSVGLLSKR